MNNWVDNSCWGCNKPTINMQMLQRTQANWSGNAPFLITVSQFTWAQQKLPVDELVDDDNVSGLNLLTQRAAGRGDQQMCAALLSESPDVRLVVHTGRHNSVLPSMSEDVQEAQKAIFKVFAFRLLFKKKQTLAFTSSSRAWSRH